MLQEAQYDFVGHAANILTTKRYRPPTIGAGTTLHLEYCPARLTYGNHYDVISL